MPLASNNSGEGKMLKGPPIADFKTVPDQTSQQHLCTHDLIAIQAKTTPDAIALVAGTKILTYARLNASANQLAHLLRAKGVGPEVLVGLCLKRSVEMIVAMLGILKAGGAYVPLDPNDPVERQSFQLQDSGAKFLVTANGNPMTLSGDGGTVIRLDADRTEIARESEANPEPAASLADPAYVIYTSGSTGIPKGVIVTHSGLVNYLSWAARAYGKEARHSALVHSSISFDLTITGLYTPLLVGGKVELLPDDSGVESVIKALRQPQTRGIVKITPAHLELLSQQLRPEEAAGKVELFVIGGENLTAESLRFWREHSPTTRLINEYGPTETVVGCCVHEFQAGAPFTGSVPIGKPIDNTNLYVLDDQLKLLGAGAVGELYIGGAGVARGYLNRPELTREHFLADPFSDEPGARMYKTGDRARCGDDGTLEFLGRLDDQVKIRGYRIELGEVERVMSEHAKVRHCVAVVREDQAGNKQLASYVIPCDGQALKPKELRDFLRRKLPEYMVPTYFVTLDAFPLTPNGKVDRRALPVPEKTLFRQEFIPPNTAKEFRLAAVWTELLGISPISVTDSFFDLGGHSLLAARLLVKVEQLFGKQLSMAALFQAPTIRQLAVMLEAEVASTSQVIPIQPAGSLPPFFCIGAGPLFRPLASRIGTDRPFLSLMPSLLPELKQLSAPYHLEPIAVSLANSILDYQKEGPYYLGGWSASGVVAYETARQLTEKGHEVALLAMFDTANPAFQQRVLRESWLDSLAEKLRFFAVELLELKLKNAPIYLSEKMMELRRKIRTATSQIHYKIRVRRNGVLSEDPEQILQLAVSSYRPSQYVGRLVFFKAAEGPTGDAWDLSRGWSHLVSGSFEVCEVPGDHRSMFREPNVQALANNLIDNLCRKGSRHEAVG
jgi:amino acid adenylation domain-containing protein